MYLGFLCLLLFCFGIAYFSLLWALIFGLVFGGWMVWKKRVVFGSLVLIGVVVFRVWVWMDESYVFKNSDDGIVDIVLGTVCFEPDIRRGDVRYILCVEEGGRVLWKNSKEVIYEFGDKIELECYLEIPFEEKAFSYKKYLKIFKVDALCDGSLLSYQEGRVSVRKFVLRWKNWMIGFFDRYLLEPVSSLMNGILFGSRRGFSEGVMDDFARTGLTHIIAVSGYNVALVLLIVESVFRWVPRRERFFVEFFSLVLFAFLTGLSASVIRACVMGVLTLWALRAGKKASFSRVLLWCVLLMALWNPAYLYFDISFHLSVLATLGVVFGSKVVGFKVEEDFLGLKEAFVMTLFAQLFTTPLVLRSFDYLSLVSPLANVLVAPFLPVLMFLGVLLMIVEYVFPFGLFSWIVVWIIEVLGRAFFGIVEVCSRVDFLVVELEGIDRTLLVGGYFLCFVLGMGLYSYWVES